MHHFQIGQRWMSVMEPELGLGVVTEFAGRLVKIQFPASQTVRQFAVASAPLKRVEFKIGDSIQSRNGDEFKITDIKEQDGLLHYIGNNIELIETDLYDKLSFTTPVDRMLSGFTDSNHEFNLRLHTLQRQYQIRQAQVRGFIGGRVDLIPHQLYVAQQISDRHIQRVLLSDETGLGKTIEVCLVLHRLLISERIRRVLIVVPNSLVHQWFIELFRRFNLTFRIIDDDYMQSLPEDSDVNPFLNDQLCLCSIDFFVENKKALDASLQAGWEMLVVDEAHHLVAGSDKYELVEKLGSVSRGMMLLTATPEQLGHHSHFERLHLLDPARFHNFELFEQEEKSYLNTSQLVSKLLEKPNLDKTDAAQLTELLPEFQDRAHLEMTDEQKQQIISELLDRHGTGRAVFRNTRTNISGFPVRQAHLIELDADEKLLASMHAEFQADQSDKALDYKYRHDKRIAWLLAQLVNNSEKILLICHSIEKVYAIEKALRSELNVDMALFHEEMTLLQRDRNAAWFAQPDGAQICICSEIGSEGRNFQFCHHLVLFDLPINPELLEQRIGRLDRIGQKQTIHIHIPYFKNTAGEVLAQWYHLGLNALEKNVPGIYQISQKTKDKLTSVLKTFSQQELETLIERTQHIRKAVAKKLISGRDRLLELNSFHPKQAEALKHEIEAADQKIGLEKFMLAVFDFYHIDAELLVNRTYQLNLDLLNNPEFPLPKLRGDHFKITFSRSVALAQEDIEFLTWDHPMVTGVMELLLGSEKGNSAMALWKDEDNEALLIEAVYLLECVAPPRLYVDRFLAPTPIRIVVNHALKDKSEKLSSKHFNILKNAGDLDILSNAQIRQELLPKMLEHANLLADEKAQGIIEKSQQTMQLSLRREINRLDQLHKVNSNIQPEEIELYRLEEQELEQALSGARVRLDAIRLIYQGDVD